MVVDAYFGNKETDQPTTHPLAPHTNITGFVFGIHYHIHLACTITSVKSYRRTTTDFRGLWSKVSLMACKLIAHVNLLYSQRGRHLQVPVLALNCLLHGLCLTSREGCSSDSGS